MTIANTNFYSPKGEVTNKFDKTFFCLMFSVYCGLDKSFRPFVPRKHKQHLIA